MSEINLVLIVAVVVLLAVVAWLVVDRQRSQRLRSRFGSEYDRAVADTGSRRRAEAELADRERRVATLEIRDLPAAERDRFAASWREAQERFVDDPQGAIHDADALIGQVMEARGYPVADFDRRIDDISVNHADVVEHYRIAHDIATRSSSDRPADTEQLRQAMVHYRALFDSLLGIQAGSAARAPGTPPTPAEQDRAAMPARQLPATDEPLATRRTS